MAQHGRYKIQRRVADGGMAEIFLATQMGRDGFQKPVILKRIHSAIYSDPQFRNMFIDEAHISMSLAHSNIAQVLDLGASSGRYFLVLELVDGWDLGRVLHRAAAAGVRLPRELALHITADVCRALAYAHSKTDGERPLGIVHRDVSPHNILLSEQGEVKLTDFGIAKAMNKREHTGVGVVKGKVAFMSPEQALGKPIDARSDLFSLGTVLYLLVTRARPFEGPSELETLLRVQKGEFRPPQQAAPDLHPEVAALVARAMQPDPDQRYQTADEMLVDVERVLRTVFHPVGQTELKKWLADLSARDGVPPISRSTARTTATHNTGSSDLDEQDVILLDTDAEVVDGKEPTLAVVAGGGGGGGGFTPRPRATHTRVTTPDLPVPEDAESRASRAMPEELALPVPEDGRPQERRRLRRGGGFSVLLFGALLVGGAWYGGKYAWVILHPPAAEAPPAAAASAPAPAATQAEPPPPEVEKPKPREKHSEPAPPPAAASGAAGAPAPPVAVEPAPARHPAEAPPAHEGGAHRHASERTKDIVGRDIAHLKDMMAPDPSLLPATPATPPPPPPPTPPPSETP
ncbi:MAG TPA: serine/threonine-protein kinase [Polyangia bacterium]|nr:serine/threonine-protein kinase [Polyangia bacterium]